jgi:diadenosine tetraphosphatase ApaH/serine/threonine PP2A family protein phosphatase
MRYLVISDIHANLEALEATLAASDDHEGLLVLGDLVGYGADPNPVVDRIRALPTTAIIRGNHDKVAVGLDDVEGFNYLARQAIEWTARALTPDNRAWLAALPKGPVIVEPSVEICHGAPFDEDCYIFDDLDATRALRAAHAPLCLYGHTHVPAAFRLAPRARNGDLQTMAPPRGPRFRIDVDHEARYLVNCGAVGQPRDGDPQAAFGLLDTDARVLTITRVPYDVATAQAKIIAAGLPEVLAQRLAVGR